MAIIKHVSDHTDITTNGQMPDQFVSEKVRQSNDHIKKTLDYLSTIGEAHVRANFGPKGFVHNYNLVKGILRPEDFFIKDNPQMQSFVDTLLKDVDLPEHVQHYSILNSPLNVMVGELTKRPDYTKVKAYDEESKSEQLQYMTEITKQYIMQQAKAKIMMDLAESGEEVSMEDVEQLTLERVEDELTDYTSLAEKWANRMLMSMKAEFNFKEISEECFRDLLISSRDIFHVYEDNSKTGFNVENLNPASVFWLSSPDKKYLSDPSGKGGGAYAAGIVRVMELSEIIQRYNLPKKEIDHLRDTHKEFPHLNARPSNFNSNVTGEKSIKYDTYSPLLEQERMLADASLMGNTVALNSFLGGHPNVTTYDNKFTVVETYHLGKKKIGLLSYLDENGEQQSTFVDEHYETIPNEVNIEWGYTNQWYKGLKIGHEVYHLEAFDLLDYCPIIGVVHDIKNATETKSFVDMLKNFQTIYNICINQIFKLLEKEYGNTLLRGIRSIPVPKDGDPQDAIDLTDEEMRRSGVLNIDDSPENMHANQQFPWKAINLERTNEIKGRWELAQIMKAEAWELVGISKARTGSAAASMSATGVQTEMTQSYAQTEPYFAQHEYVVNQVYQALIDAAQHIAVKRPESTISYVSTEGEQAFMTINTDELKMRDLKVFVTSRAEDQKMFEELRALAQPMLQNGAPMYDVSVIFTSNSIRQMKQTFKTLKEKQEAFQSQSQQLEQAKIQQAQQELQISLQAEAELEERRMQNENYNKELDRLSKERIAIIQATGFGKVESEDLNADNIPDVLEVSKLAMEHERGGRESRQKQQELMQRERELLAKNDLEREKIKVARENMKNDKEIAQIQAKAAKAKKAASKPKSKK